MLTKDERWRINHAHKFIQQAKLLLEECRLRPTDPDSVALFNSLKQLGEPAAAIGDIHCRLGTIPFGKAPARLGDFVILSAGEAM